MTEQTSLDQTFWNSRWLENNIGWDIGHASPAITKFMENYTPKDAAILIPGCGNAYEAEWLVENGFTNITLVDIAPKLVSILQEKFNDTPQINVVCDDFFAHQGRYDVIIEQTFFCALPPVRRNDYALKTSELLKNEGRIIGVLFDIEFEKQGPPFGGLTSEYRLLFEPYFDIVKMEKCYNSIPPRADSEVFINLQKK